jgi:regulator of sigma E protease
MSFIDSLVVYVGHFFDYVVPFLIILTIVVFVHELGHYLVARRNGVRVEVFSIGFGKELWGWTDRVGTRWKISAIPLGGYVKMFGEFDAEDDAPEDFEMSPDDIAGSFHHKRLGQRAAIVVAGPVANFVFAIVVLAGVYGLVGNPAPKAAVGQVMPDSAAADAGIVAGDLFVSINDEEVIWFEDLYRIVSSSPGLPLLMVIDRGGETVSLTAIPKRVSDASGGEIGQLGVRHDPTQIGYERMGPFVAMWLSVQRSFGLAVEILSYVRDVFVGNRSADGVRGVVGIAQMSGEICQGGIVRCIFFASALSVNLGLINLFPIPMLDGGHLVFYAAEGIRGRRVNKRVQEYGFRFGLVLVIMLFVFATWNDLVHLEVFEFIRQLVT